MSRSAVFIQAPDGHLGLKGNHPMIWRLEGDLKRFKKITQGVLIMGRHTFESLPDVLPGRPHIVVTSQGTAALGVHVDNMQVTTARTLHDAFRIAEDMNYEDQFVIGGGELINEALPYCDHVYRSLVKDYTPVGLNGTYAELPGEAPYWGMFELISLEDFPDHVFEVYTNPHPQDPSKE